MQIFRLLLHRTVVTAVTISGSNTPNTIVGPFISKTELPTEVDALVSLGLLLLVVPAEILGVPLALVLLFLSN